MADSTSNIDAIIQSQPSKEVTANAFFDAASPAAIFGRRASTSSGLTWGYYGGRFTKADGTNVAIANGTLTLTASATNYVEADSAGAVTKNTTGFTDGAIPLYTIVVGTATVTSYTDHRDGSHGNYPVRNGKKRIGTYAYAANITVDWGKYDLVRITLTGNTTLTFSGAVDGQNCHLELKQDATGSRLATMPASVRYSADIPSITLTTTASKFDKLGFQYHSTDTKYDLVSVVKGY